MPAVLSKASFEQRRHDDQSNINLANYGVPTQCLSCTLSCDVCMVTCTCERCVLRRRLQPSSVDCARIAMLQTQQKIAFQDRKKKKKIVFESLKSCIVKVTKKGSYKKAFHVGVGADRVHCCKKGFEKSYGINHTYVDELIQFMKKKVCIQI